MAVQHQYKEERLVDYYVAMSAAHPTKESNKQMQKVFGDNTPKKPKKIVNETQAKTDITEVNKFAMALSNINKG